MSNNTMSNDTMLDDTIKKCGILLMTSALTCDLEELNTRHTLLSSKIKRLERKAKTNKSYEKKLEEATAHTEKGCMNSTWYKTP